MAVDTSASKSQMGEATRCTEQAAESLALGRLYDALRLMIVANRHLLATIEDLSTQVRS